MPRSDSLTSVPTFSRRVREQVYDHVFGHLGGEVGGVLVGDFLTNTAASVTGAIPALQADGQRASVTFTHEAWAEIHSVLERRFPDKRIVGWYHSHPGFGIFLSDHDLFIHQNFFSDPAQLALVVDPYAGVEGVFGWEGKQIVKLVERPTSRRARRPAEHAEPESRARRSWRPFLLAAAIGVLLGLLGWFAVLRPDGSSNTQTATTGRRHAPTRPRAHPQAINPQAGQVPGSTTP